MVSWWAANRPEDLDEPERGFIEASAALRRWRAEGPRVSLGTRKAGAANGDQPLPDNNERQVADSEARTLAHQLWLVWSLGSILRMAWTTRSSG